MMILTNLDNRMKLLQVADLISRFKLIIYN